MKSVGKEIGMREETTLNDLRAYAAESRWMAAEAEAQGNLPLAQELAARAAEAEELFRQVQ